MWLIISVPWKSALKDKRNPSTNKTQANRLLVELIKIISDVFYSAFLKEYIFVSSQQLNFDGKHFSVCYYMRKI